MYPSMRRMLSSATIVALMTSPAAAQQRGGIVGDLLKDVNDVEQKLVALAREMPAEKYSWRPGEKVRSVGEVYLHVASDNYFLPITLGVPADPATGITATDFKALDTFEHQKLSPEATAAALEKSFAHLKKAMSDIPDTRLGDKVTWFGQEISVQRLLVSVTTHLHEHLGQSIAYARTNGVVPPWSKKGG